MRPCVGYIKSRRSASQCQQNTFNEHLLNHPASWRAQGQPDRGLRAVGRSASQQEVSDVRAGNQQDQRYNGD